MSALPLMCRTAILAFALVALTAGSAYAAPVSAPASAPAKLHRKTTAPAGVTATRHATSTHSRHRAAPAQTRTRTQVSDRRKPISHESGRTAGLAIRRQLAQEQAARRNVALHANYSPVASHPENQHARPAPAMEVASASPVFLPQPAPAEESEQPQASLRNQSRASTPAPAPSPNDGGITNEEMDSAGPPDAGPQQASLRVPLSAKPTSLRGSHESLERQNTRLDAEGLERIEDESDLVDRIARKVLVPLPASSALTVNAELSATHRYCRPWTALFLADLSRAHAAAFHRPLEVSSAVRTMEYQKRLMQINGNAAPAEGDIVSPHLTGATIDIAKDGLSRNEMAWMRQRLLALEAAGKIDVEEEFRQACFHITVYKTYAPPHPATQAGSGSTGARRHKAADPSTTAAAAQGL